MNPDPRLNFEAFFEQLPYAVHVYGRDGLCMYANAGWEALYQSERRYLEGYNILEDPQLERKGLIQYLRRAYAGESVSVPAFYYNPAEIGKNGRSRWIESDLFPYRVDGEVIAIVVLLRDVTEKVEQGQDLESSYRQMSQILQTLSDGVMLQDRTGKCIYANPTAAKMCGFESPESMLKSDMKGILSGWELLDEKGDALIHSHLPAQQVFQGIDTPPDTIMQGRNRETGETSWGLVTARPIKDFTGDSVIAVSVFKDITVLRNLNQAQASVRDAELRFRQIAENFQEVFWIAENSPLARTLYMNPASRKIWGHEPEAFLKNPRLLFDSAHEEDRSTLENFFSDGIDEPKEIQFRIRHREGGVRWIRIRAFPIRNTEGAVEALTGFAEDITEKVQTLEELKKNESRARFLSRASSILGSSLDYETTLSTISNLIVPQISDWCTIDLLNPDGSLRLVALSHVEPAKVSLGYEYRSRFEPSAHAPSGPYHVVRTGKPLLQVNITDERLRRLCPNDVQYDYLTRMGVAHIMLVPLQTPKRILGCMTLVSGDAIRPFTDDDLEFAVELANRAALAVEHSQVYQRAQAAVQARDDLLAVTAHELKTPLTSLKLQLQIAEKLALEPLKEENLAGVLQRSITVSGRQVDRLTNLIESILDYTRVSGGRARYNYQSVKMDHLLRDLLNRLADQAESFGVSLTLLVEENLHLECDSLRIEQVFVNLITNALKYGAKTPVTVHARSEGSQVRISIMDQGPGIPHALQERIFERFERAVNHSHVSGFGLGLYISREIVHAHHGRIWVESEPDQGATFHVTLPVLQPIARESLPV